MCAWGWGAEVILQSLKHTNIIFVRDYIETNHSVYIVLELVLGGELFDKIVGHFFCSFKYSLVCAMHRVFPVSTAASNYSLVHTYKTPPPSPTQN